MRCQSFSVGNISLENGTKVAPSLTCLIGLLNDLRHSTVSAGIAWSKPFSNVENRFSSPAPVLNNPLYFYLFYPTMLQDIGEISCKRIFLIYISPCKIAYLYIQRNYILYKSIRQDIYICTKKLLQSPVYFFSLH